MSATKLGKTIGANMQKARKARRYTYYAIFAVLGVKAADIFPDKL
jgi:hypothetical protein